VFDFGDLREGLGLDVDLACETGGTVGADQGNQLSTVALLVDTNRELSRPSLSLGSGPSVQCFKSEAQPRNLLFGEAIGVEKHSVPIVHRRSVSPVPMSQGTWRKSHIAGHVFVSVGVPAGPLFRERFVLAGAEDCGPLAFHGTSVKETDTGLSVSAAYGNSDMGKILLHAVEPRLVPYCLFKSQAAFASPVYLDPRISQEKAVHEF
jgi:hypothetical protein